MAGKGNENSFWEFYKMAFRKLKADQLFDGFRFLGPEQVLVTDENGIVQEIIPASDAGGEVETFEGILSPGLINCHCHLELSHLKNVIPPHTGLIEFLCSVVTKRDFPRDVIDQEIISAETEMSGNGIVAVGDIGNTADTAGIKEKSRIRWQNFVEVLGFTDDKAGENIRHYQDVAETFKKSATEKTHRNRTVLVPHAPYTISPKTFERINQLTEKQIISIHNQEHPAENDLYRTGGGGYLKLFKIFGIDESPFPVTGKSSLQSVLPYFNKGQTIFLVHNTCTPEEDILFAKDYAQKTGLQLVWCLCLNANLYIENKLPPVELLLKHDCSLVLGTDSYSSNWQLSIAKEMQTAIKYFPTVSTESILQWATSHGARALQWDDELGSFEKGKKPGIALIKTDFSGSVNLS